MREWDEITRDVLRRRDEKIAQKKAQMRIVKRTAVSALCFCLVSTAGIGIWKNIPDRSKPVEEDSNQQLITDETSSVSDITSVTGTASSAEDKVTYTQADSSAASTHAAKPPLTTATSSSQTASARTSVTQSKAVTSRIAEGSQNTTQTNAPEHIVTTDINGSVNGSEVDNERSFIMKKFFAALAAASTMVNPITANASPIVRFDPKEDLIYNESAFSMYESGSEDPDLNGDGVFDVQDLYYNYVVNHKQVDPIYSYYIYKNGIRPEDYRIENFFDENNQIENEGWWFFLDLGSWSSPYYKSKEIEKIYEENNVNLDFNADGSADVKDLLDYWLFAEYFSKGAALMNEDYMDELVDNYGVEKYLPPWNTIHRLYSIVGKELPDLGFVIPDDKYLFQFPLDETTLKNCAQHLIDHWYITDKWDRGEVLLTKEFVNCCGFTEEWLDPDFCEEYLYSRVDESVAETDKFKDIVDAITGKLYGGGYGYSYMGEARVDAIEAGFVNYDDYKDVLSRHSKSENYSGITYPEYEKAVNEGRISVPDLNYDGALDDKDMELLSVCYYAAGTPNSDVEHMIDVAEHNIDIHGKAVTHFEEAIRNLDCNKDGEIADDFDLLYTGIYIAKNGHVDFDLYSEFFSSDLYTKYEDRTWRYYERDVHSAMSYGYYYSYIIALADLLFDMDTANGTAPDALSYAAPYRSGDATTDGETNISDAVLIMQTICNPAKYKLSLRGEFNADVNNTNDGITPKDALVIQRRLLGLQ